MMRALLLTLVAFVCVACHDQRIPLASGKQIDSSAWKNRWVMVTYWAGWCEQCEKEIPALNAYQKTHASKVLVLGVNFDGLQGDPLKRLVSKLNIQFPVINGPYLPFQLPRPDVLPVTYLLDKKTHKVTQKWVGPELVDWLEKYSEQKP